jgi:hypothetical protein
MILDFIYECELFAPDKHPAHLLCIGRICSRFAYLTFASPIYLTSTLGYCDGMHDCAASQNIMVSSEAWQQLLHHSTHGRANAWRN